MISGGDAYANEHEAAAGLAARGWSQPDIRHHLARHYGTGWLRADMLAGDAVDRDNARRMAAMMGRAA